MTLISNKKWSTNGFTLLEILVAMALIAIALLSTIQLHSHNLQLQTESQLISTVNFLSSAKLAEIQAAEQLRVGSTSGDFGEDYPLFRYKEDIESLPDMDNLYKVTVTIFQEDQEPAREFVFETYIYRKET